MFEDSIFLQIIETWGSDQDHPYRGREKKSPPNMSVLKNMFECAFNASLEREEEKSLSFNICFLSQWEFNDNSVRYMKNHLILRFKKGLPFNVDSIIKIAPSTDPNTTAIIAGSKTKESTELEIWGLMYFDPPLERFGEIPVDFGKYYTTRPDTLIISVLRPGSLLICRGSSQIGRFTKGTYTPAIPTPFNSKAMGKYLYEFIKDDEGFKKYSNFYWHLFRDSLNYLLYEAAKRGHGGTILFTPNSFIESNQGAFILKYFIGQDLQIEELINSLLNLSQQNYFAAKLKYEKLISQRLDFLSQLSCIDGALIITGTFKVISFGATLVAEKWNKDVIIGPDGFGGGGNAFDYLNLGTRHNSTINFIGKYDSVIRFVISQDGPIRGLVKKDQDTILCWPDCTASMTI